MSRRFRKIRPTALTRLVVRGLDQTRDGKRVIPCHWILSFLLLFTPQFLLADLITFDGLTDGTHVSTQFPNLVFSNATVATAGISLNELEFPPHSGTNVAFDDGGPISIDFLVPALSFDAYFTYSTAVTLTGFDLLNNPLPSVFSAFTNNEALSGFAGSHPNELLGVSFAAGISHITITGDPLGGSFALDDATITTGTTTIPEPSTYSLLLLAILTITLLPQRPLV